MLFVKSLKCVDSCRYSCELFLKLAAVCLALCSVLCAQPQSGQSSTNKEELDIKVQQNIEKWILQQRGVPEDWSHRHLVFSNPGTEMQAVQSDRNSSWQKVIQDPRFTMQLLRRQAGAKELADKGLPVRGRHSRSSQSGTNSHSGDGMEKDWSMGLGSGGTINPNTFPAKWNYDTSTASCTSDFVIYPTGSAGSSAKASIIAYYNLYSGCGGTVPSVDWAYNTGGQIILSPVFNLEGTQVAFVQTVSSVAYLTLLKFPQTLPGSGTLTSPDSTLTTAASASAYTTCTAPCVYKVALNGSPNDTWSPPYYDYIDDTLYVGDNVGKLHKFYPVFYGSLTEVTSSWPVQLKRGTTSDTTQTNGPVYDPSSGRVFVGTFGGYLYAVTASSGAVAAYTARLDAAFGLRDSVLIDSSAAKVYAFVGRSSTGNHPGVYQFATSFTSGATGTSALATTTGAANTNAGAYGMAGAFDNTYFNSTTASSPTGNLYFTSTEARGGLYQIPITSNTMGTPSRLLQTSPAGVYGKSAPLTEFYNDSAGHDLLFMSTYEGNQSGCTASASNGCIMSFNITTASAVALSGSSLNVSAANNTGAPTGGIVVDNAVGSSTMAGASQIYFGTTYNAASSCTTTSTTNAGLCAVQASQTAP